MFSVNVSRLSQTPPNEVLNAPSKELKTSGFGLTSLAFEYFLTTEDEKNENDNENENYSRTRTRTKIFERTRTRTE
jgi:hypothetical protein